MHRLVCAACFAALSLAPVTRAQEPAWYIGASVHRFDIRDADSKFRDPGEGGLMQGEKTEEFRFKSEISSDTSFGITGGFHAPGNNFRLEFEYREFKSDIDKFGTEQSGQIFTDTAEAEMLIATTWGEIRGIDFIPRSVVPYFGIGLGFANVRLDDEEETTLVGQVGGGIGYRISDMFTVDLGYRYFETDDLNYKTPRGEVNTEYKGSTVNLGLRWYLSRGG